MREEQREEESISSYVASIEKSTTEDEIVETATKATSSSNIYSGFAELLSALEKKNSSKNEKSTRLLELFSFGTFEEYREKDTSLPKELNGLYLRNGPNPMQSVNNKKYHWFSGEGMLHGLRLEEGEALWYRNRRTGGANTHVISHADKIYATVEAAKNYS